MQHGRERRQGVIDELLGRGFDRNRPADPVDTPLKGPKFTVVATATDGGDPAKAVESIAAALRAHPEVKGILGLFSYSAGAALKAIKQVGRSDQLKIVGFDASDETQAALQAGTVYSSILQDSYRCGYETIEVLANEARGISPGPAELSPILTVRVDVLTNENLAHCGIQVQFLKRQSHQPQRPKPRESRNRAGKTNRPAQPLPHSKRPCSHPAPFPTIPRASSSGTCPTL